MTFRTFRRVAAAVVTAALGGCSPPQWYGAGQAWQRHECQRVPDVDQRQRCLQQARTPHEDYRRQADALAEPPR